MSNGIEIKNRKICTVTLPNAMGGVASFNRNIIKFFNRNQLHIRIILISIKEVERVRIEEGFLCDEQIEFTYSQLDNYHHVCKKLGNIIGFDSDFVLTDNGITLDAISVANINPIVHYLNHDFFYVKQALNYIDRIDYCIAHSTFFNDCLMSADYSRFEKKLIKLPYGVPQLRHIIKMNNTNLKLVFLGRLDYSKGAHRLIQIENQLAEKNINVDWLIIGDGPLKDEIKMQWENKQNVLFSHPKSTTEVYSLLETQDLLIFPSLFEGTPVAIFEALSCGCVPIVYNIPGGVREYLNESFSYKIEPNSILPFVDIISDLNADRDSLSKLQNQAFQFAQNSLEEKVLNEKYFDHIILSKKNNEANTVLKLNFLDKKYIPNWLCFFIKKSRNIFLVNILFVAF